MSDDIQKRASEIVDIKWFNGCNSPGNIGELTLNPPKENQYLLRLLIEVPYSGIKIPKEYKWVKPLILAGQYEQKRMGIRQCYTYLTIRHGAVSWEKDDEWHTDGFSTSITHIPEQNYIWVDSEPTEYIKQPIRFPNDFDPLKHNVHLYIQDKVLEENIKNIKVGTVYVLDPYVIHRRPPSSRGTRRTFVRVSFTPIEIVDCNNSYNPAIPRKYARDGCKDFRDNLIKYIDND